MKVRAWVADHAENLALGLALGTIGVLVAWWGVFARRMINAHHDSAVNLAVATLDGPALTEALAGVNAQTDRFTWMIAGESSVFIAMLAVAAFGLFGVARRRRDERDRMERVLQITTHELKTPVAGLRMLLQSLQIGSIPPEVEREYLGRGLSECDRLEHLVETILAYQRSVAMAQATRQRVQSDVLLSEILDHRLKSLEGEVLEVVLGPPVALEVDRDQVRVILENLLDNARKYGGDRVWLQAGSGPGGFQIEVRDEGVGFDPKDAQVLFDPFARGLREGVTHGSGLGLHLSRELAQAAGGTLVAKSPGSGQGATFTLTLPQIPPEVSRG